MTRLTNTFAALAASLISLSLITATVSMPASAAFSPASTVLIA